MPDVHVIVISSVHPEPTSAGQVVLHRHLVNQPGITLEVHGFEPVKPGPARQIRRIAGRLGRTRLHRFIEDFWVLWQGRWLDPELPKTIDDPARTVVLTVAHGDGFMAAQRFARRHKLPLVAFFQDWWPDIANVHAPLRATLEKQFRDLYHDASASLCVSEGMRDALGPNPKGKVLFPLASPSETPSRNPSLTGTPFKVCYSGNLTDYGPMLGEALEESLKHPEILLQVRGSNPNWPEERKRKMRENGRWLDFAPRAELESWLASADAFLVPMVFDSSKRRRMETSFPSKLIEFAQFGKPLVIWGPEYCSAVRWAQEGDKAICVTTPDPDRVIHKIFELQCKEDRIAEYLAKAQQSSNEEFDPEMIQREFCQTLKQIISNASLNCDLIDKT